MPLTLQSKRVTKKTKVEIISVSGDLASVFYLIVDLATIKMEDTDNFNALLKANYGDRGPDMEAMIEAFMLQVEEGRPQEMKDFVMPRS